MAAVPKGPSVPHGSRRRAGLATLWGSYTAIYRPASRLAHAEVDSVQAFVQVDGSRFKVSQNEKQVFGRAQLALPITTFALLAHHHQFGWPEAETARSLSDAMTTDV